MPNHDLTLTLAPNPTSKGLMRMPVGRHNSGPLWVDGSIALRVRDKRQRAWRMVKIRHPHAVIGRHSQADLVINRPDVAEHHVFLFLDARGLFGVDLRTERGTRFAGTTAEAAWLGAGDLIEVGDHAIEIMQLRVNGVVLDGPLADDNPLGLVEPTDGKPINDLTLRLLDDSNANWSIGSSLVFLGRGPACAVSLAGPTIGLTHSALLRAGSGAYLVPFPGETARLNDRPIPPGARLTDEDILTIGNNSLLIQTHDLSEPPAAPRLADLADRLEMAVGTEAMTDVEFTFGHHVRPDTNPVDYPALLGRLQAETAAIIGVLLRRIEALDEEMAALRDRLDANDQTRTGPAAPPVEKLRWELIPQAETDPSGPGQSGVWLVDRLRELEAERQTTWSNLVNRIGPTRDPD